MLDLALIMLLLKALIAAAWAINYWVLVSNGLPNDYRPATVVTVGLVVLWIFGAGLIVTAFVEEYNGSRS